MKERRYRSFAKAATWRMTGTVDTVILSWLITGKLSFAISIGLVEVFTKVGLYYIHERVWDRVKLGREAVEGSEAEEQTADTNAYARQNP